MNRKEKAIELFKKGYNCSQAVVLSYADILGADEDFLARVSVSYGGGTGRMRLTCGAVNAMFMVAGLLYSSSDGNPQNKNEMYKKVQYLAEEFRKKFGTINCGELLGGRGIKVDTSPVSEKRTEEYYKRRPCIGCMESAVEILDKFIAENPPAHMAKNADGD